MTETELLNEVKDAYGFMFESGLLEAIAHYGTFRELEAGSVLIEPGQAIKQMPLLLEGSIKIMRMDDEGGEMLLYYIERGDTCAMSMTCCIGNKKSEILAVTEEATRLVMLPVEMMDKWLREFQSWKEFVFDSYNQRLHEMLEIIDTIAFLHMDERLLKYLQDKVKVTGSTTIHNTHQEIANELHTSRVVVSRLLKKLEKQGEIELHRNRIEVLKF